jgi:hypothetical protein
MKRKLSDGERKNQEIVNHYFNLKEPISIEHAGTDEEQKLYRCRCGTERSIKIKTGYSNLMSHITGKHTDYEAELQKVC